jgi:predicted N-acetyltransferase YhbS
MTLRDYTDNDYLSVCHLLEDTGLLSEDMDTRQNLIKKTELQPGSIIVAENKGRVIGCVYTQYDGWKAVIARLAVDENLRGHGVGRKLMEEAERRLKAAGAKRVNLYIHPEDGNLEMYYKNGGYTKRGEIEAMSKDL